MLSVNIWAVLASGIVAMILGGLWYGPLLGKQWIASMGGSQEAAQEKMKAGMSAMWKSYLLMFIAALIMAYVLGHSIIFAETYSSYGGPMLGAWIGFGSWLGFVVPATLGGALWEGKSWKWWFITAGYYLVSLIVMGLILAIWA